MPLTEPDRDALTDLFVDDLNTTRRPTSLSRAELRAAIAAIDAWVDANQASFVAAIPQPARSATSVQEKVQMMFFVLRRRYEMG